LEKGGDWDVDSGVGRGRGNRKVNGEGVEGGGGEGRVEGWEWAGEGRWGMKGRVVTENF